MKAINNHRSVWPLIGLCFALLLTLGSGVAKAQKDKGGGKADKPFKHRFQPWHGVTSPGYVREHCIL